MELDYYRIPFHHNSNANTCSYSQGEILVSCSCSKSQGTFQLMDRAIIYLFIAATYTAVLALPSSVVYPNVFRLASFLRSLVYSLFGLDTLVCVDGHARGASCPMNATTGPPPSSWLDAHALVDAGGVAAADAAYPMLGYITLIWIGAVFGTVYQMCCHDRHNLLSVIFYVSYGLGPAVVITFLTVGFLSSRALYEHMISRSKSVISSHICSSINICIRILIMQSHILDLSNSN